MDWSTILDYVLKIAGSALASLLITFASILFAKLKSKIQDSKINNYILQVVQAAEQLFPNTGTKTGTEKYAYVVEQVLAKFPSLSDNEYLKSLIEGAVYTVSEQVKQIAATSTTSTSSTTTSTTDTSTSTASVVDSTGTVSFD